MSFRFRGVGKGIRLHKVPSRYKARIRVAGKTHHLGEWEAGEDAAVAYDEARIFQASLFGCSLPSRKIAGDTSFAVKESSLSSFGCDHVVSASHIAAADPVAQAVCGGCCTHSRDCTKLLHIANLSCSLATDVHGIVYIVTKSVLRMVGAMCKLRRAIFDAEQGCCVLGS